MKTIITIAKNTFLETIRDRVLMSVWFVIIGIILFSLFVGSISHDHNVRIITNFSITAIYLLQVFIALFIGSFLMYKEIERKTFYLILPKPVSRSAIIVGKMLGLSLTTLIVTSVSTLFLFILLGIIGDTSLLLPIALSTFLSYIESVLLILIALLFSSLMAPVLAFVSSIAVYFIAHGGDIYRFIYTYTENPIIEHTFRTLYLLVPNFEKFNIRNDVVYGTLPTLPMLSYTLLYAAACGALFLFLAVNVFKKRDF
jgi:ABC-type transport system involved in multi-copper enzyme maturation permease subunit